MAPGRPGGLIQPFSSEVRTSAPACCSTTPTRLSVGADHDEFHLVVTVEVRGKELIAEAELPAVGARLTRRVDPAVSKPNHDQTPCLLFNNPDPLAVGADQYELVPIITIDVRGQKLVAGAEPPAGRPVVIEISDLPVLIRRRSMAEFV